MSECDGMISSGDLGYPGKWLIVVAVVWTRTPLSRGRLTRCYLFTVSNSGLLSMQRLRPASRANFRHSHIPELICGVNSSI